MKKIATKGLCPREKLRFFPMMLKIFLLSICLNSHPLDSSAAVQVQKITLELKHASLNKLFLEIEKCSDYSFVYNTAEIEQLGARNFKFNSQEIEKVLEECLKGSGYTYQMEDRHIIIKRAPIPQASLIMVKGKVTDEKGNPLPGVGILVKGTTIGAATDVNGEYSLPVKETQGVTLIFSFVGMKKQEVELGGRTVVNVVLEEENSKLEEVVVTGYFERKKDSYTGSATTFSGEQLKQISTSNVLTTLSMVDPSFKLMENLDAGSNPNHVPEFTIHGGGNLQTEYENSPNMPTFILDGFEVNAEKIFDLDPNRVASITILKDAAATAIYGSRAANGVVVVETKAPQMGQLRISYNFSGDFEIADLSDYNLMNAAEKLEYERRAKLYDHPNVGIGDELMDGYNERLALVKQGVNTDWITKPVKSVGFSHKHSLYVEGGDTRLRYGLTLNYQDKEGVMRGSGRQNLGVGVQLQYRYKTLKFMNDLTFDHMKMENSPYGDFSRYTWLNPYYYP